MFCFPLLKHWFLESSKKKFSNNCIRKFIINIIIYIWRLLFFFKFDVFIIKNLSYNGLLTPSIVKIEATYFMGFSGGASGKEPTCQCMRYERHSIPGWGRSPGKGHGNPLQYSCLGNPTDRRVWWGTVLRVAKNQRGLKRVNSHPRYFILASGFAMSCLQQNKSLGLCWRLDLCFSPIFRGMGIQKKFLIWRQLKWLF